MERSPFLPTMSYRGVFEIVFVLLLVFSSLAFGGIEPWPITIIELTVLALFTAFLVRRFRLGRLKLHFSPLFIPLLAFFVLCVMQLVVLRSDPFSSHGYPHTLYRHRTRDSLLLLLSYVVFFYTAIHSFRSLRQLKRLVILLGVFGFLISVLSIIQRLSGTDSAYWIRKMPGKFYGPFFNENNLSNYLMMIFLLNLGHIIYLVKKGSYRNPFVPTGVAPNSQSHLSGRKDRPSSAHLPLFVFFLVIILVGIIYSGSRGSVIITIFSSMLLAIVSFNRRIPKAATAALLIVVFAGMIVSAAVWTSKVPIYRDGEDYGDPTKLELRVSIWRHSIEAIKRNPVFGSGLGTYREVIQTFLAWDFPLARLNCYVTHAHNEYLELISDTGILGFVLFMASVVLFIVAVVRKFVKRRSQLARAFGYSGLAVMLAMGIHSLVDFSLRIPANGFLFAAICSITYFGLHCHKDGSRSLKIYRIELSRRASLVGQFVTILLGIAAACVIALPLFAKMADPVKEDDAVELAKIISMENEELVPRLNRAVMLDRLDGSHRFHLTKANEKDVRSLLNAPSGVVFDKDLYARIDEVFDDYRKTLQVHNTNGYYHMSLGFFAMVFVDFPEMADFLSLNIPAPNLKEPAFDPTGNNVFFDMCYTHMQHAVEIDPSNPNLHRGLYMGCFYLSSRVRRDGRPEIAEKLVLLGKEECRRFLEIMPVYYDAQGREHSSIEQALRYFARYVSTDADEMDSIIPERKKRFRYLIDRVRREFTDEETSW